MAEQQYIYVATPAVVAAPASYAGYTSYSQAAETAYVQPGYTAMVQVPEQTGATYVVPSYQYDSQLQFSQPGQAATAQTATQPEYAMQTHYATPGSVSGYTQQLAVQQATAGYAQQANQVVYGSQAHLAAMQQAGQQQQLALAQQQSTAATQGAAYGQQQLTMPLSYGQQQQQQQQQTSQPGASQYVYQQSTATYAAAAAPPQSVAAMQTPTYAGSTLISGLTYAQQQTAQQQQSLYNTQQQQQQLPVNQTNQPPPSFTYQQQQQITALQQQQQQQQQQVANAVAAAYGQQPQQTLFYGQQQQHHPPPVMPGPSQPQTMPFSAHHHQQQQQQQQQMFLPGGGDPGNAMANHSIPGQMPTSGMGAPPGVRPSLSLPGPAGSMGSNLLHLNQQQRFQQGFHARGLGNGDHRFGEDGSNHNMMGGGQGGEMEIQKFPDTIFIQGLPEETTEEKLVQHFSAAGKMKLDTRTGKPRITIVKDKVTGRPRGEATLGFQDVESAQNAIKMFNNKDFHGRKIRIEVASRKIPAGHQPPQAVKRSRPGEDALDWICPNPSCNNENFAWRTECNRCKGPRHLHETPFKGAPLLRSRLDVPIRAMPPANRMGMGLNLGGPNMLRPNNLNNMAVASIRARLGGVGLGLGPLGGMPGGPIRGAIRGRMDRRGGRPY